MDARALKLSSKDAEHVRDTLELLNNYCTKKGGEEVPSKTNRANEKGEKGNGIVEESQKKRKLSHSSSIFEKFGTIVVPTA